MEPLATARAVLGWATVLNLAILALAGLGVVFAGDFLKRVHGRFYRLSGEDLDRQYFQYLANYKILIFVYNLGPYLALRIVG